MVIARSASSNPDDYDDDQAVQTYLDRHWAWYMTEFEKRCYDLGMRLAKASTRPRDDWSKRVIAEWQKTANAEQRAALAQGFTAFAARTRRRIMDDINARVLRVNRCPQCHRVVRTPTAQQCFWYGHDWHA
jgi:hypothetical protein